ncbi:glycosyltransferase [Alphaproteobacteria bacterium]|nr:glycosyltransferase [Alphaproteobacteria bacterium]
MIKVIHIINGLGRGGAEIMLLKLLQNQNKDTVNLVVCLKGTGVLSESFQSFNINVKYLNVTNIIDLLIKIKKIFQIVKSFKPTIVMSWLHISDLIGVFIKIRFPYIKLIWNIRCSAPKINILGFKSWLLVKLLSFFSTLPNCIIANSHEGLKSHIGLGYKPKQTKVIPNGFDTNLFKPNHIKKNNFRKQYNIKKNQMIIGFVGRDTKIKGLDIFINSAGIIHNKINNIIFVYVGDGLLKTNRFLYKRLKDIDCIDNSLLLGGSNKIEDILCVFDILLLTSRSEGFPNILGEAMSCGVPCVVTDVGECKLIVGDSGVVINSFDSKDIAEGCENLLKKISNNKEIFSKKAQNQIKLKFNLHDVLKSYDKLIMGINNER